MPPSCQPAATPPPLPTPTRLTASSFRRGQDHVLEHVPFANLGWCRGLHGTRSLSPASASPPRGGPAPIPPRHRSGSWGSRLEVGPRVSWRSGPSLPEERSLLPFGPQISCPAFQTPQLQPRGAVASDLDIPTCLGSNRKVGVCLCTDGLASGGAAKECHFNR